MNIRLITFGLTAALGYWLAYLLFHEMIISALLDGGNAESEMLLRSIFELTLFQLICGFLPAIVYGAVFTYVVFSYKRFKDVLANVSLLIVEFCGFTWGFIFYFPWQFCLLILSAV